MIQDLTAKGRVGQRLTTTAEWGSRPFTVTRIEPIIALSPWRHIPHIIEYEYYGTEEGYPVEVMWWQRMIAWESEATDA